MFKRKRGPKLVTILGSGPAALFAAQAVYDTGNVARIIALRQKSKLYGAQYLHAEIPGLDCGKRETVNYILKGTVEGYRAKVYGPGAEIRVSPETLASQHDAWNIRSAYEHAWDKFSLLIPSQTQITPTWLDTHGRMHGGDLVVWAIPLAPQCVAGHGFLTQEVWAQGDAPELDRYCSVTVEPWTVVTNGEESPRWYRASNVFGYRTAEWPGGAKPPVDGVAKVRKPVATNCNCWLQLGGAEVLRVGRYGTWMKSELSHEAYFKTRAKLERM